MDSECPRCRTANVRRAHRQGIVEYLMSLGFIFPHRCKKCGHRFMVFRWRARYAKQDENTREGKRILKSIPVEFLGKQIHGEGVLEDLSPGGCRVKTNVRMVKGAQVQLQLLAETGQPPILVESAVVQSVRSTNVSLQFARISPEERTRLSEFIQEAVDPAVADRTKQGFLPG